MMAALIACQLVLILFACWRWYNALSMLERKREELHRTVDIWEKAVRAKESELCTAHKQLSEAQETLRIARGFPALAYDSATPAETVRHLQEVSAARMTDLARVVHNLRNAARPVYLTEVAITDKMEAVDISDERFELNPPKPGDWIEENK